MASEERPALIPPARLLIALTLLSAGLAAQDADGKAIRIFDLGAFAPPRLESPIVSANPSLAMLDDWVPGFRSDQTIDWLGKPTRFEVLEAIDRLAGLDPDGRIYEVFPLVFDETSRVLVGLGTPGELESFGRAIRTLQQALCPAIDYQVTVFTLPEGFETDSLRTVLDRSEAESLRRTLPVLFEQSARLCEGRTFYAEDHRWRIYQADAETEGTSAARISDPRSSFLVDGVRLRTDARRAPDGEQLILTVEFLITRGDEEIRPMRSGDPALSIVEAPMTRGTYARFEAPTAAGETLCCWSLGRSTHGPDLAVLISARLVETDKSPLPLQALRVDTLTDNRAIPSASIRREIGDDRVLDLYHYVPDAERDAPEDRVDTGHLYFRDPHGNWLSDRCVGPFLLAFDPERARSDRALLAEIARRSTRRFEWRGRVPDFDPSAEDSEFGIPSRGTGPANLCRGYWTQSIFDYEFEISMGTSPPNPRVNYVFDGLHVRASVDRPEDTRSDSPRRSRGPLVRASVAAFEQTRRPPLFLDGFELGTVYPIDQRLRIVEHRGTADGDELHFSSLGSGRKWHPRMTVEEVPRDNPTARPR